MAFCCITEHQGRDVVSAASERAAEIESLEQCRLDGRGLDIGGATANMWHMV